MLLLLKFFLNFSSLWSASERAPSSLGFNLQIKILLRCLNMSSNFQIPTQDFDGSIVFQLVI